MSQAEGLPDVMKSPQSDPISLQHNGMCRGPRLQPTLPSGPEVVRARQKACLMSWNQLMKESNFSATQWYAQGPSVAAHITLKPGGAVSQAKGLPSLMESRVKKTKGGAGPQRQTPSKRKQGR